MVNISPSCNLAPSNYLNSRASIHASGLREKKSMDIDVQQLLICYLTVFQFGRAVPLHWTVHVPPYSNLSAHMLHVCYFMPHWYTFISEPYRCFTAQIYLSMYTHAALNTKQIEKMFKINIDLDENTTVMFIRCFKYIKTCVIWTATHYSISWVPPGMACFFYWWLEHCSCHGMSVLKSCHSWCGHKRTLDNCNKLQITPHIIKFKMLGF